jgi:hypothetical protein
VCDVLRANWFRLFQSISALPPLGVRAGIVARGMGRSEVAKRELRNVRFGSIADIGVGPRHVRFTPKSGHSALQHLIAIY